jgi:hypothetical protein
VLDRDDIELDLNARRATRLRERLINDPACTLGACDYLNWRM